jgi:protein-disulfide isomerase
MECTMIARSMLLLAASVATPALVSAQDEFRVGHAIGAEKAAVLVVEFLDFGCSACAQFAESSFPAIRTEYIETGRVRWVAVPFVLGAFRNSEQAARAASCAAPTEKFWVMHDSLFRTRRWSTVRNPDETLRELASSVAVDTLAFNACYRHATTMKRVRDATALAAEWKVSGTPTFLINGRRVVGAPPLPLFRRMLEDATARSWGHE